MGRVVDPSGVKWWVRRRWYPWHRALSLRDFLTTGPAQDDAESQAEPTPGPTEPAVPNEPPRLPKNPVVKACFMLLGLLLWVVLGIGKVLGYAAVIVLFVAASLLEFALQLLVMPFVLLLRWAGIKPWPVEIARSGKHFATRTAPGFDEAGRVRDALVGEIEAGVLPEESRAEPADVT